MSTRCCRVIPALVLLAAGCELDAPKPGLDGVWAGVHFVNGNGKEDDAYARTIRWTIKGDTIAFSDQRIQEAMHGTFKLDDTKQPKTIDASGQGDGASFAFAGILEQDGDRLKVCYVATKVAHYERPTEFEAKPAVLLTLKRIVK